MHSLESILQAASQALKTNQMPQVEHLALAALKLAPKHPFANYLLGVVSFQSGRSSQATKLFKKALKTDPNNVSILNALGASLRDEGKLTDSLRYFRQVCKIQPSFAPAFNNTAVLFKMLGQLDEAETAYRRAVKLDPKFGDALNNLGMLLQDRGDLDEAITMFDRAAKSGSCRSLAYSNYLWVMNYSPKFDANAQYQAHREWGDNLISEIQGDDSVIKSRRGTGKIKRIAYVSPDFRRHSVAYFFLPLIQFHDKQKYEIYCYYTHNKHDEMTDKIKAHANEWRDVAGLSNESLKKQILADEIDVLIDLSGHTGKNRLEVFASRAAPMQVTWLGYPNTTGLSSMDLRFSDEYADPKKYDEFYSERQVRLPDSFLCYLGDENLGHAAVSPCQSNGYITFGSFNNLTKVTEEVLAIWAQVLSEVDNSKLLLKSGLLNSKEARLKCIQLFKQHGIDADRLDLRGFIKSSSNHLSLYDEVDIGLDPFPYNGTTTTCEALWMGVPVITVTGDTHASRVGASLLSSVGLDNLVAKKTKDYIQLAKQLAANTNQLNHLRRSLRATMKASPLCDGKNFALNFETALEANWTKV